MGLKEQLEADLKEAMKAQEVVRRDTLRMTLAAMKNRAIELGGTATVLDEDQCLAVVLNAVKTRKDSASQYDSAGREDLAATERAEIAVLQGYLPQALSEEETKAAVEAAIQTVGADSRAQMGQVIKTVMGAHKGSVDGKLVQRLCAELLS
ncbi:MAG TPA: GatB/YqeY domain-containing protein [Planctomycetes bacterium]|jgi:uncharacterized protein YqeY|nr:GatB/YqeY domain-containing protein [Planctomycetota bacterium]HIL37181.1 GatB/YqeY domain-containing protein [Planctomycetota bacterium]